MAAKRRNLRPYYNHMLSDHHACVIDGVVHAYTDGRWLSGEDGVARILAGMDLELRSNERHEVYEMLRLTAPQRAFSPARYVQFANGVLDIDTMDLEPPSPELIVPTAIPWAWYPSAKSDAVEEYLDTLSDGNAETLAQLEEVMGAAISRVRMACFWALTSPRASAGKSQFADVVTALVGADNAIALDVHQLGDHFMTVGLRNKLLCVSPDTPSSPVDPESRGILKRSCTQDLVRADVKNRQPLDFRPFCTMLVVANSLPALLTDEGLKRRCVPIVLTGQFPEGRRLPSDELANERDMPALLMHAMAGLARLMEAGPTRGALSDEAFGELEIASSTVEQWCDDNGVNAVSLDGETCQESYRSYASWAADSGTKALPKSAFEREVRKAFGSLSIQKCRKNGSTPQRRWVAS